MNYITSGLISNPYLPSLRANAFFTFVVEEYIIDPETGNYTKKATTFDSEVLIIEANLAQSQDPNLQVQESLDYNRIYFEGYLITPKTSNLVVQSRDVAAVINGYEGTFDFIPRLATPEEQILNTNQKTGQPIAGYFRLR